MRRIALCAASLLSALVAHAQAQSPALPETYSFLAASEMMGSMNLKVNRNDSRELVEMTMKSGGTRLRLLYDFQAHKVYSVDLDAKSCTMQEYASPYAPVFFDPIGGSAEMVNASGSMPVLRKEAVNGIGTKLVENDVAEPRAKYRVWLEEKFSFPVKQALIMESQPERLVFEMRQLSYEPSPASLFTPPPDCRRIGGVSTATGGHAEAEVNVEVQGQTQLGQSEPAEPRAIAPEAASAPAINTAPLGKVTAVGLRLIPESYTGPCPSRVQLVGNITTDGPGTVFYDFLAGAVRAKGSTEGTIRFDQGGTKTVTLEAEYVSTPEVPGTLLLAVMEGADGTRPPQNESSEEVEYRAKCTGQ